MDDLWQQHEKQAEENRAEAETLVKLFKQQNHFDELRTSILANFKASDDYQHLISEIAETVQRHVTDQQSHHVDTQTEERSKVVKQLAARIEATSYMDSMVPHAMRTLIDRQEVEDRLRKLER